MTYGSDDKHSPVQQKAEEDSANLSLGSAILWLKMPSAADARTALGVFIGMLSDVK